MNDAEAKKRLIQLALIRLGGMALTIAGLAIWQKQALGIENDLVGKIVLVLGMLGILVIPALLRRHWRTRA